MVKGAHPVDLKEYCIFDTYPHHCFHGFFNTDGSDATIKAEICLSPDWRLRQDKGRACLIFATFKL